MPPKQPTTPSSIAKKNTLSTESSIAQGISIEDLLRINGMPIEDPKVRGTNEFKIVHNVAKEVLGRERDSPEIGGKKKKYWKDLHEHYVNRNEQTFRDQFFIPFTSPERNVSKDGETYLPRRFADDGLDCNSNQPFVRGSLPKINTHRHKSWQRLLNTHARIKNPVPDFCWGYSTEVLTRDEEIICLLYNRYTGISSGIWNPSVLAEFKQWDLKSAKAQCARGGAALVNTNRQLALAMGKDIHELGADKESIVYSFAVAHETAQCFVHWVNVTKEGPRIVTTSHMHLVAAYSFPAGSEGIFQLRHDLNNILDWVVDTRKSWFKNLLAAIEVKDLNEFPMTIELEDEVDNDEEDEDKTDGLNEAASVSGSYNLCDGQQSGASGKKRKTDGT
ncbi:MAG: hypothetical protein Q9163_002312 [Psora crenata]